MSAAASPRPTTKTRWSAAAEIPLLVGMAIAIVVVTRWLLIQPFYIPSPSMVPELQVQDKVVVSRLSYRFHPVHRGDIVVFDAPPGAEPASAPQHHNVAFNVVHWMGERLGLVSRTDVFIKRVVGLPGETVEGHDGHVYLNGRLLLEPYLPAGTTTSSFAPVHVPAGDLWLMGDNRGNSEDSRAFGPVRRSTVVGRAFLRLWPPRRLAFL